MDAKIARQMKKRFHNAMIAKSKQRMLEDMHEEGDVQPDKVDELYC